MGEGPHIYYGSAPQHLPLITTISYYMPVTQSELSSLTSLKAWGDKEKFCHDITFLLVSAEEEATWNRKYGLSTIWVNPCLARVPSMEKAVKELTAWVSSEPNWPYALVQLNKDTCHVPLPKEGHLGILPEGGTDSTTCRRISQLEVCQLLICRSAGHLPSEAEWMQGSHHYLPT